MKIKRLLVAGIVETGKSTVAFSRVMLPRDVLHVYGTPEQLVFEPLPINWLDRTSGLEALAIAMPRGCNGC